MRTAWHKHKFRPSKLDTTCATCGFPRDAKHHLKKETPWTKKRWERILSKDWKIW